MKTNSALARGFQGFFGRCRTDCFPIGVAVLDFSVIEYSFACGFDVRIFRFSQCFLIVFGPSWVICLCQGSAFTDLFPIGVAANLSVSSVEKNTRNRCLPFFSRYFGFICILILPYSWSRCGTFSGDGQSHFGAHKNFKKKTNEN